MTMSISSAPASTAWRVSASLISRKVWPDGKPVATLATWTPEPASASRASATQGRVDAHGGDRRDGRASEGSGRVAFAQSAWTLPGVSLPSSVVRSIMRMTRSSAQSFDSLLMERLAERGDPLLDPDLVDRADPPEQAAKTQGASIPGPHQVVGTRLRLLARGAFDGRCHVRIVHRSTTDDHPTGRESTSCDTMVT